MGSSSSIGSSWGLKRRNLAHEMRRRPALPLRSTTPVKAKAQSLVAHEGHPHVPGLTKSITHHLFSTITATEREAKAVTVSTSSASWCCASRKEQPSLEAKRCTATQYLPAGEGNVREGAGTGVSRLPLQVGHHPPGGKRMEGSPPGSFMQSPLGGKADIWAIPAHSSSLQTLTLDLDHRLQGAHGVGVGFLPHALFWERVQLPRDETRGSGGRSSTQGLV